MHPSALIGERIFGEYTIVEHLGDGATGAVYLARQDSINKEIAVKVLQAKAAEDDETVQRFQREAQAISLLTHPNIIRVLIFGRTDSGLLYLAMEYVEGDTLHDLMQGPEEVDEMKIIKIFKQLCSAVAEAHEMGIIHRDLKPENILLTEWRGEKDFVKILDFGLAKIGGAAKTDENQNKLTKAGVVYGTPAYLSPEQAQALELDRRCDIYTLGCILYEFMTGRLPFTGETAVHVLGCHVHDDPTPPSQIEPGVHRTMEEIILKAMAKEPDDRFQHAGEMLQALEERELQIELGTLAGSRAAAATEAGHSALPGKLGTLAPQTLWLVIGIIVGATGMLFMSLVVALSMSFLR